MKTKSMFILAAALGLSGCATPKNLATKLSDFEKLGVSEVVITGKFSHTDYTVTRDGGVRKAVINHTNLWVPQVKIVRETKE